MGMVGAVTGLNRQGDRLLDWNQPEQAVRACLPVPAYPPPSPRQKVLAGLADRNGIPRKLDSGRRLETIPRNPGERWTQRLRNSPMREESDGSSSLCWKYSRCSCWRNQRRLDSAQSEAEERGTDWWEPLEGFPLGARDTRRRGRSAFSTTSTTRPRSRLRTSKWPASTSSTTISMANGTTQSVLSKTDS